jgi:hypothetical protein
LPLILLKFCLPPDFGKSLAAYDEKVFLMNVFPASALRGGGKFEIFATAAIVPKLLLFWQKTAAGVDLCS